MGFIRMTFIPKIVDVFCRAALCALVMSPVAVSAQEVIPPSSATQETVRLEAEQQRKEGDLFFADGKVEIQYKNLKLRADHMQYNAKTFVAVANGDVQLDVDTQHLEADSADFNVRSGEGRFEHVRGSVVMEHRPNAYVLV